MRPSRKLLSLLNTTSNCYRLTAGLRFVVPYADRWERNSNLDGQRVYDVLSRRLPSFSDEELHAMISAGRVLVDGDTAGSDDVLRPQQRLTVKFHRHEPEVTDAAVTVLHEDEMMVAVHKPASIPVHPVGSYRKNTVLGILESVRPDLFASEESALRPIHRIDRRVSGVLLLGRGSNGAKGLRRDFLEGRVVKEYVARVDGIVRRGEQHVHAPIGERSPGVYGCGHGIARVKHAHTILRGGRVIGSGGHGDGMESIVHLTPVTGRTHQLRVHLAHLGHPVVDDSKYNAKWRSRALAAAAVARGVAPEALTADALLPPDPAFPTGSYDETCPECARGRREVRHVDPLELHHGAISLHALRYSKVSDDGHEVWSVEAPRPLWSMA